MRRRVSWFAMVMTAAVVLGAGLPTSWAFGSAAAAASRWHLRWSSPRVIRTGAQVAFTAIDPCPKRLPDGSAIVGQREVFVAISFTGGGAKTMGPITVHKDGSWAARLTPSVASTVHDPSATIQADCDDVGAHGSTLALGEYNAHHVSVNP